MPPETTPMMQQYLRMKELHPDCILFFRLGDFYEMFNEDAKLVSKELELTLTSRDRGKPEAQRTPMCGVPYHSADAYIARLIAKGYKVAICEQMEDPALAKGLVDRDIIRIITPGTVMTSSMLEEGRNNFICAVYRDSAGTGLCFCDISTGECSVTSFTGPEADEHLYNELGRFTPREQRYRLNPLGYRCSLAPFTIAFFCFTPRSSSVSTSVSRPRAAPLIAASGNSMSPR